MSGGRARPARPAWRGFSRVTLALAACAAAALLPAAGCSHSRQSQKKTVVVYTSQDQVYAEPVFLEFQRRTGIEVQPVYDGESAKNTGLIARLLAKKDRPDCDVFWSGEMIQTERLGQEGLLEPYVSPQAERFPPQFRDPEGRWTGFAGRMRVIIYNTNLVKPGEAPSGLKDFVDPKWRGKAVMGVPFYGTVLTHMAALHQLWGPRRLSSFLADLRANDVALAPGNGPSRDMVADGRKAFGLTDTDDAHGAVLDGKPVAIVIPDAEEGALFMPNTVALIRNCPHGEEGRKLIDYLLSAEVEKQLAAARAAQIPLAKDLADVKTPWSSLPGYGKVMALDVPKAAASVPALVKLLQDARMDQ